MNGATSKSLSISSRDVAEHQLERASGSRTGILSMGSTLTILRFTYGLVPIVAGLDKFTNLLTNWVSYLNPIVLKVIPLGGSAFMHVAGIIEVLAGIVVLARPRIGGFVVSAWLVCIALSLIASGNYLDVAVRDLVMAIGAFTLANLAPAVEQERLGGQ